MKITFLINMYVVSNIEMTHVYLAKHLHAIGAHAQGRLRLTLAGRKQSGAIFPFTDVGISHQIFPIF
jgi:hypothetical protein